MGSGGRGGGGGRLRLLGLRGGWLQLLWVAGWLVLFCGWDGDGDGTLEGNALRQVEGGVCPGHGVLGV